MTLNANNKTRKKKLSRINKKPKAEHDKTPDKSPRD